MDQELLEKANSGDTQAMVELVKYYLFEAKDTNEAIDWADKAVSLGEWNALTLAVYGHNVRLTSCAGIPLDFWSIMNEDSDAIINYLPAITKILPHISDDVADVMRDSVYNARYFKAVNLYHKDKESNSDTIIALLDGIDRTREKMLLGLTQLIAKHDNRAYRLLLGAYTDKSYCEKSKPFWEECMYGEFILVLSMAYRLGEVTGTPDCSKAVDVIQYGLSTNHDETFVEEITKEYRRYRKTLFGWKYS